MKTPRSFLTPSAVHLHIGATVGLSASPALCEFLDTRYFRFIGLKCCMLLCLSYSAPFENTSRNSIGRHAIFLWQVEGQWMMIFIENEACMRT